MTSPDFPTRMNFVGTIGRNEVCPCGSGKKYKKCCLEKHEAQRRLAAAPAAPPPVPVLIYDDDDGLEELSNSVVRLIRERRFDEALAGCRRLLDEFPEVVDGYEHSAMIHEMMGNHAAAAELYEKALKFIEQPDQREGFDPETFDFFRSEIAKNQLLASSTPNHENAS